LIDRLIDRLPAKRPCCKVLIEWPV